MPKHVQISDQKVQRPFNFSTNVPRSKADLMEVMHKEVHLKHRWSNYYEGNQLSIIHQGRSISITTIAV